jgi:hypothetical protein
MKNVIEIQMTINEANAVLNACHDEAASGDGPVRWFFERLQGVVFQEVQMNEMENEND